MTEHDTLKKLIDEGTVAVDRIKNEQFSRGFDIE